MAKLAFLRQLGAPEWDLSDLNPNRRKFWPKLVVVPRVRPSSGCPIAGVIPSLVVLLHETTLDLVDEIVDLFNRALKKTDSRSRREPGQKEWLSQSATGAGRCGRAGLATGGLQAELSAGGGAKANYGHPRTGTAL